MKHHLEHYHIDLFNTYMIQKKKFKLNLEKF